MFFLRMILPFACLVPLVSLAADRPTIKTVTAQPTSPKAGPEMFKQYCAACHGIDGKGHGPAVPALKIPPPDLTLLTRKNHGKFPDIHVYAAIQGDINSGAHGSKDMPVWGNIFRDMANTSDDDRQSALRMSTLCRYIESLQQK